MNPYHQCPLCQARHAPGNCPLLPDESRHSSEMLAMVIVVCGFILILAAAAVSAIFFR